MSRADPTAVLRPFLPTKDFAVSVAFHEALGFAKELESEVAIFRVGTGGIILQRYYQKDWAENTMLQLLVDELAAWWRHTTSLDLPRRFGVAEPRPPAMQPWGVEVAFLFDPAGVLWHMTQRR